MGQKQREEPPQQIMHPLAMLPVFIEHLQEGVDATAQNLASLREGAGPGVLDAAEVERVRRVYADQTKDLGLFRTQRDHWRTLKPAGPAAAQLGQFEQLLDQLVELTAAAVQVGESLVPVETLLAAPDALWGLAALLGHDAPAP